MAEKENIVCVECNVKFTMKKNLYVHLRKIHDKEPIEPKELKQICDICGQQFVNKSNFSRHMKQMHKVPAYNHQRNSRIICPLDCPDHFSCYEDLRKHLTEVHKVKIEYNECEFESVSAFHQWKDKVQESTLSFYVLHTSSILLADGSKKEFYNCHRSYNYIPKGKGLRTIKGKGTNKTGAACPSRMEVITKNKGETIQVKFWKTHIGHSFDIGRIFLSKETRTEIAGKLKDGVTFDHILNDIRDAGLTEEDSQRILLLEKKDMHNIARDFHIDYNTKYHQNDAISIRLWVEDMRKLGDECPVLAYKEQGMESGGETLNVNDFALIIMTSFQAQQLLQLGSEKICIDGTHGTNSYDFQLFTIMTVDELGSGSPVAFCFSNRADEAIFNYFFEHIKLKVGIIETSVFMSDDAPAFYNAWCHVMSPVPNRLLCTWHVDKNWRQNLSKIRGGVEKRALVYKALRVILQSTSVEDFNKSLSQVLSDLYADEDTIRFAEYFSAHYANRPQCWAYCYRLGIGINTNMYLESLHKTLKHVYLEGKKVKRLDKSVNAIMKIARDSLYKRLIKLAKNSPTEKIKKIRESHLASQKFNLGMITPVNNGNEFLVDSSSTARQYMVVRLGEICSDSCLKCCKCNICVHSFTCSCVDNVIKLNVCKHIHACASLFFKTPDNVVDHNNGNSSVVEDLLLEVNKSSRVSTAMNADDIKRKAELVIGLCDSASLSNEDHRYITNSLDKIISTMNKRKANHFNSQQRINPNAKIDKQVRLFSTKKKKKSVNKFKKPAYNEEKNIMNSLLNKSETTVNIHTGFDHTYTK